MSVFVQMISPKPPNILLPNLVLWCITMSWSTCKRVFCYFQGQGHCRGSYDQIMIVPTTSAELLILLLPNLIWWYSTIRQNVLWRNVIVVFKVKVTATFQIVNECLSRWYILNHWTFCHQTWYGGATLWARLSSKKLVCCRQGHSEGS